MMQVKPYTGNIHTTFGRQLRIHTILLCWVSSIYLEGFHVELSYAIKHVLHCLIPMNIMFYLHSECFMFLRIRARTQSVSFSSVFYRT